MFKYSVNTLAKTNVTLPFSSTDDQREEINLIKRKMEECIARIEALEAANLRNSYARHSYVPENNTYYSTDESMYFPTFTALDSSTSDIGNTYSPPTTNTCSLPNPNIYKPPLPPPILQTLPPPATLPLQTLASPATLPVLTQTHHPSLYL